MNIGDPRIVFCPLDRATRIKDSATVLADRWWIYYEGRGVVFYRHSEKSKHLSPRCNANEQIADTVRSRLYPWGSIRSTDNGSITLHRTRFSRGGLEC